MKKGVPIILFILFEIITVLVVFIITYQWQQSQITSLKNDMSQMQNELNDSQQQKNTSQSTSYSSNKGVTIRVFTPTKNGMVTSPFVVLGEVPGNWSFEATFPIDVKDSNGVVKNTVAARVIGDWMTSDMVPFSATVNYDTNLMGNGTLVLRKDNPSGLPENDDSVTIPLMFKM